MRAVLMGDRDRDVCEEQGEVDHDMRTPASCTAEKKRDCEVVTFAALPEKVRRNYKVMQSLALKGKEKELRELLISYSKSCNDFTEKQMEFLVGYLQENCC